MINVGKYVVKADNIPADWIFSHYLKLGKLKGQSVKMKSIFNEKDSVPSLIIYYNRKLNKYTFKDFSSGHSGSAIEFMKLMWKCSFSEAMKRIKEDYQKSDYNSEINNENIKLQGWKVTSFVVDKWKISDIKYWNDYHITIEMLEKHKVKPIKSYTMSFVVEDEIVEEFIVKNKNIYGYFYGNKEGNLAKIYQPFNKEKKFIKVSDYIQGSDQNTNSEFCFIVSSLKDAMALKTIGIRGDFVCVDSENTLFTKPVIARLKRLYGEGNIIVIFDNDIAGINNMKKYKELYNLKFCYLPYEKDPAEILKAHGIDETRRKVIPLINKKLNNE